MTVALRASKWVGRLDSTLAVSLVEKLEKQMVALSAENLVHW
jgi:hypothetical protein